MTSRVPNREVQFSPSWKQGDAATSRIGKNKKRCRGLVLWHTHKLVVHTPVFGVIAILQKDSFLQKLNFDNTSSAHQFTKKKKWSPKRKSAENYAGLRREN